MRKLRLERIQDLLKTMQPKATQTQGLSAESTSQLSVGWGWVDLADFSIDLLPEATDCKHMAVWSQSFFPILIQSYSLKGKEENILVIRLLRGPCHLHKYPAV